MKDQCPCGSGEPSDQCCLPIIAGQSAATAEALMRSRYTAYVLLDADYLLATWADETRPPSLNLEPSQRWLGLKIKRTEAGGKSDTGGLVEFVARYKIDGRGYRLHETSRFRNVAGRWFYVDGTLKSG